MIILCQKFHPLTKIWRQFQGDDGIFCAGHMHSLTYLSTIRKYYSSSSTSAYVCTRRHVVNSQNDMTLTGPKMEQNGRCCQMLGQHVADMLPTCRPTRQCRIKIGDANIRQTQLSALLAHFIFCIGIILIVSVELFSASYCWTQTLQSLFCQ